MISIGVRVSALFLLLLLVGRSAAQEEAAGGEPVASGSQAVEVDCLLHPSIEADIASPVIGVIRSLSVKRGDYVAQGKVLFRLRAEVEQATLALNRAKAEFGKRTIERNIDLFERSLISEQEKDEIIINNSVFEYEMRQSEAILQQKTVTSPFSGVVVDTYMEKGEYVGDEPVLRIAKLDPLHVEAVVASEYIGKVSKGDKAALKLAQPFNSRHEIKVIQVDRTLDAASGTFGVRLALPNPEYRFPAGLKCAVRFGL